MASATTVAGVSPSPAGHDLTATGVQGTEFTAVLKLIPAKHTSHRESLDRVPRTNPSPAEQEDIE